MLSPRCQPWHGLRRARLIVALHGAAAGIGPPIAAAVTYEDARAILRNISDLHHSAT
jgi:hypothetical protein